MMFNVTRGRALVLVMFYVSRSCGTWRRHATDGVNLEKQSAIIVIIHWRLPRMQCVSLSQPIFCSSIFFSVFFIRENVYFSDFFSLFEGNVSELVCEQSLRVVTEKKKKVELGSLLPFLLSYFFPIKAVRYVGYWRSLRSRWLDISQVVFCLFMDWDTGKIHKQANENGANIQPFRPNKLGQLKNFKNGFRRNFSCSTRRVYSTQDLVHLACSRS